MECRSNGLRRNHGHTSSTRRTPTFNGGSDTTLPEGKGAVLHRFCKLCGV